MPTSLRATPRLVAPRALSAAAGDRLCRQAGAAARVRGSYSQRVAQQVRLEQALHAQQRRSHQRALSRRAPLFIIIIVVVVLDSGVRALRRRRFARLSVVVTVTAATFAATRRGAAARQRWPRRRGPQLALAPAGRQRQRRRLGRAPA
jgi:hypothetical protein